MADKASSKMPRVSAFLVDDHEPIINNVQKQKTNRKLTNSDTYDNKQY